MPVSVTYDTLSAAIREHIQPKLVDNLFYGSDPFMSKLRGRRVYAEGADIRFPLIHSRHSGAMRWGGGTHTFDVNVPDAATKGVIPAVQYISGFGLPETDIIKNKGIAKVFDLVEAQMKIVEQSLIHVMNTDLYLTGATSEDTVNAQAGLHGLTHALTRASDANGSYAGISRSGASGAFGSPTANSFWNAISQAANSGSTVQHFYHAVTMDSSAVLTSGKMMQMFGAACAAGRKPDMVLTSQALSNKYFELNTTIQRHINEDKKGNIGYTSLEFNFVPLAATPFINAATSMYFLNSDTWQYMPYKGAEFDFKGMLDVPNARVQTGSFMFMGNIACLEPNKNAVLTGATAS